MCIYRRTLIVLLLSRIVLRQLPILRKENLRGCSEFFKNRYLRLKDRGSIWR